MSVSDMEDLLGKPSFLVGIEPGLFNPEALTIARCRDLVLSSQVRLGGWSFPYARPHRILSAGTYVQQQVCVHAVSNHTEEWRMYRSGQFVFRALLPEVANESFQKTSRDETEQYILRGATPARPIPGFLSFMRVIYRVTEAYMFAARLAQGVPYQTDVKVRFVLQNIAGWALASGDPQIDLEELYQATTSPVCHEARVGLGPLVADPAAAAVPAAIHLFEQFRWFNASPQMITQHQSSYIRGK